MHPNRMITLRRAVFPAALCCAATLGDVLFGTPASAQTEPAPATPLAATQPARTPAGALVFSLGTDVNARDRVLARNTPGVALQLGYERRLGGAGSPFALRLAGDYWRSGGGTFTPFNAADPANPYTFRRHTSIVGGSLFGVYHLPSLGAVRPYALAGIGVYQYSGINETDPLPGGGTVVYGGFGGPDRKTSFGYGGGLGASAQLGRISPFAEFRFMRLSGLQQSPVSSTRQPVALGVRIAP